MFIWKKAHLFIAGIKGVLSSAECMRSRGDLVEQNVDEHIDTTIGQAMQEYLLHNAENNDYASSYKIAYRW